MAAFFYGTLIHPQILRRVIGNPAEHLAVSPAVLLNADYPAIVPTHNSQSIFQRPLTQDENSVRGILVTGLTDEDIRLLDIFEGDEYTRETVSVHPLVSAEPLNSDNVIVPRTTPSLPPLDALPPAVTAQTYVWVDSLDHLEPAIWEYSDFVKDSAWKWVGKSDSEEYVEVDKRREMNGKIVRTEIVGEGNGDKKVVVETA
ncbi:hypothetical protein BXZ70DRAFT_906950 [Cristinia sonorae]|uniref:Putative gamma-glutamylcyclotransferase n=1 Tax=Cristinia sonorae TaxID=1940300 RepID=A0A8K0UR29_9AGAR|nr:hypothetical protein BXZ70DRAFT_906950 [Cristinia sonorae]